MSASTLAFLILLPFVAIFAYATWHEYRRYKQEGPSSYGLTYDPETNTTVVGAIPEGEDSFDPDDFEPDQPENDAAAEDAPGDGTDGPDETDHADTDADDSDKERRT
jgi:hypothetical protein